MKARVMVEEGMHNHGHHSPAACRADAMRWHTAAPGRQAGMHAVNGTVSLTLVCTYWDAFCVHLQRGS
jgi:hypothetical protein